MDEIEALKAELEQTKIQCEMLTQLNQVKTGFLGRIAHELRSPFSTMMGLHQLILSDLCESPEEERDCVAQAYQAGQRFLKMIDDLVNVSKIEYGTIPLHLESIFLKQVFWDLYQLTYLQAANRNLKLNFIPSDVSVIADRSRLLHVLFLLIDGVISISETGTIQVRSSFAQNNQLGLIQIKSERSIDEWQKTSDVEYSLNLKLLLSEKLLTLMGGELFLKKLSPELEQNYLTMIEIILPIKSTGMTLQ
ncbi:sensor histidine kinase KdpD [Chroococcus sp. FPU101]|uniref:sensor histidine kinase n=1 Tax=Chroococcus sp. FPU101 TaxID=1974212 RepID=UPI001A8F7F9E|nr:HAMP domain-containing histidine kinase [Chroococcus sp. FPU101]GFE69668.1 histidine kinase [Chroococcus sp. FPU101]